jgi:hypothetical protein
MAQQSESVISTKDLTGERSAVASVEPVNPRPPVGRWGETLVGKTLHIVDRDTSHLVCGPAFALPGFPVGSVGGMYTYHAACVHGLFTQTVRR